MKKEVWRRVSLHQDTLVHVATGAKVCLPDIGFFLVSLRPFHESFHEVNVDNACREITDTKCHELDKSYTDCAAYYHARL